MLCIHATRPRAGGALYEQSISERTGRSGPVARQRSALQDFLQARAGCCIDPDSQGKVLNPVERLRGGRGGKRFSGISPGMGALEIHDQGSNAAKTRGICLPALSVPVTLRECFLRGLANVCVFREQDECAFCAYRDFDGGYSTNIPANIGRQR